MADEQLVSVAEAIAPTIDAPDVPVVAEVAEESDKKGRKRKRQLYKNIRTQVRF